MKNFFTSNKTSLLVFIITLVIFSIVAVHNVIQWQIAKEKIPTMHSLDLITGDEPHNLSITSQIIRHHNVYMEEYFFDKNPDPNLIWPQIYYHDPKLWQSYQRSDGHYINFHPNGLSFLLIPGYAIAGILGAMITMSTISSLTSVFIYKFAAKFTTSKIAFITTMIFGFTTLFLTYSNQIYADVAITLFLISILYFIFEKNKSSLHMASAGAISGFGIFLKISFLLIDIVLVPLVFILLLKHKINFKNFVLFCGFFLLLTFMAVLNNLYTSNSLIGGGQTTSALNILFTGKDETGLFGAGFKNYGFDSLIESFFGQYHGLFIFSPVVMLFVLGIKFLWDKNRELMMTITIVSISLISGYTWMLPENILFAGDPPARYFMSMVPLMAIPFALGFQTFSKTLIYKILIGALATIGLAFSTAFAYNRTFSVAHSIGKGDLVHTIYVELDFLFPSLGISPQYPMHHPLTTYNEIFLLVMVTMLIAGVIIPFLRGRKTDIINQ